eukprot:gene8938-6270_t
MAERRPSKTEFFVPLIRDNLHFLRARKWFCCEDREVICVRTHNQKGARRYVDHDVHRDLPLIVPQLLLFFPQNVLCVLSKCLLSSANVGLVGCKE